MNAEVTRRVRFEAAHRLYDQYGKCANLHGHSFIAEVTIAGPVAADGVVLDMSRIADFFRDELEPHLDHSNLNDTLPDRYQPPSTENIAHYLLARYTEAGFPVVRVTVRETENQSATVYA